MTPIEEVRALLATSAEETQYRTVASRAYYAVYNRLRAFAEPLGFVPARTGGDHQSLAEFLKSSNKPLLTRMGVRLIRLRKIRRQADYDPAVPFSRQLAQEAVQSANEIIGWLDALTG